MATERPLERVSGSNIAGRSAFDPALTVEEVAERLKISPATVYTLLRAGALTSYKVGRSWRIDELDLVEYIERQKARHGAELSSVEIGNSDIDSKRNEVQRPD